MPTSNLNIINIKPRHHGPRSREISSIVIHYISGSASHKQEERDNKYSIDTVNAILHRHQVSYHFVISREGQIYKIVPEQRRAYHAGISVLHGELDMNQSSIGISLIGEKGVPFPNIQIDSLVSLVVYLRDKYPIPLNRIVGHDQVGWNRKYPKIDPGPLFNWLSFLDRVGKA